MASGLACRGWERCVGLARKCCPVGFQKNPVEFQEKSSRAAMYPLGGLSSQVFSGSEHKTLMCLSAACSGVAAETDKICRYKGGQSAGKNLEVVQKRPIFAPASRWKGERRWVNGFGFPAKTHYRKRSTSEADRKLAALRPSASEDAPWRHVTDTIFDNLDDIGLT